MNTNTDRLSSLLSLLLFTDSINVGILSIIEYNLPSIVDDIDDDDGDDRIKDPILNIEILSLLSTKALVASLKLNNNNDDDDDDDDDEESNEIWSVFMINLTAAFLADYYYNQIQFVIMWLLFLLYYQ